MNWMFLGGSGFERGTEEEHRKQSLRDAEGTSV
jgi:hypothetical protein